MKRIFPLLLFIALAGAGTRADTDGEAALKERVRRLTAEVAAASFPELTGSEITIQWFDAEADFFQTRFTFTGFLGRKKLRYLLRVNRRLLSQPPPEIALRAVIAHELGHILYFQARRRLQLLGLVRLLAPAFTARFERRTDLQAIARHYGEGLKVYREWLYRRIPPGKLAEKQRNYFSPAEIDALLQRLRAEPEKLRGWLQRPPRSLAEIY